MPFQTVTNQLQAPGIAGDFASANPRATVLSAMINGAAGQRAGAAGLIIGRFAWLDAQTYQIASNSGPGAPNGFVHRAAEALITAYLSEAGMTIPAGMTIGNLFDAGDFWIVNSGTAVCTPGMKAYANNTTGLATFAAAGAPTILASGSASTIAAGTGSFTASITDGVLSITVVGAGVAVVGGILSGTGVATGTMITAQLTGATGGVGTYAVSIRGQTVASTTVSETYGTLTIGGTVVSGVAIGQTITGSGVTAGTYITALGTGVGGAGTYIVSPTQTVGSTAISAYSNTETGWFCRSVGLPGDVVIISSRAMG